MAHPKKDTPAATAAAAAEVEGADATVAIVEGAAPEAGNTSASTLIPPPDPDDPPKASGIIIRVVAKQPSRWRIGLQFTAEPSHLQMDNLTEAEVAALRSDPMLDVTAIEDI